jgi:hypothetical protein
MNKKILIKKKWIYLLPYSFVLKKNKINSVFFHGQHMRHTILNWNKLWTLIQYQLNIFKHNLFLYQFILIVTDSNLVNILIQNTAKKLKNPYIIGPWKGGTLTKIRDINKIPKFVLNIGLKYPKNFYNEITIMNIPCITLQQIAISQPLKGINYILSINTLNTNSYYNLIIFILWFIKKYKKIQYYENFKFIDETTNEYKKAIKLISNKIQIFDKQIKKFIWMGKKFIYKIQTINFVIFQHTLNQKYSYIKKYLPTYYLIIKLNNNRYKIQQNKQKFLYWKQIRFQIFTNQSQYTFNICKNKL